MLQLIDDQIKLIKKIGGILESIDGEIPRETGSRDTTIDSQLFGLLDLIKERLGKSRGAAGAGFRRRAVRGDGASVTFSVTGLPETACDFYFTLNSLYLDPPDYTWSFAGTGGTLTVTGFIPLPEDTIEIFFRS